jgi:hypothetical protein
MQCLITGFLLEVSPISSFILIIYSYKIIKRCVFFDSRIARIQRFSIKTGQHLEIKQTSINSINSNEN